MWKHKQMAQVRGQGWQGSFREEEPNRPSKGCQGIQLFLLGYEAGVSLSNLLHPSCWTHCEPCGLFKSYSIGIKIKILELSLQHQKEESCICMWGAKSLEYGGWGYESSIH